MQTRESTIVNWVRSGALVVTALAVSSCTVNRQEAPELSGPSELAQSVVLSALPDRLVQDGVSQTVVTALVRDAQGKPIPGLGMHWEVRSSDGSQVAVSDVLNATDAQGRASTRVTAPAAPSLMPSSPVRMTVSATPLGGDTNSSNSRTIVVELVPPAGTPGENSLPQPAFTIAPAVANVGQSVSFDASTTKDDGNFCAARCAYIWDFGDFTTGGGSAISHTYTLPNTYTVTLTVIDDRGGVASLARSLTVNGPTPPVAQFSALPAAPAVGVAVTFDGTASAVGAGATITQYDWSFGDGSATTTTTAPATVKTYSAAGTYVVTLTVTDSLGRKATRTSTIVVT